MSPDINQFKHETEIHELDIDQMFYQVKSTPRPLLCSRINMLRLENKDWVAGCFKVEIFVWLNCNFRKLKYCFSKRNLN